MAVLNSGTIRADAIIEKGPRTSPRSSLVASISLLVLKEIYHYRTSFLSFPRRSTANGRLDPLWKPILDFGF